MNQGPLGNRYPRPLSVPATSSKGRSPSSPTSASSSSLNRALRASCTFPNWPTIKSTVPRKSFTSAMRSRSKSSASIRRTQDRPLAQKGVSDQNRGRRGSSRRRGRHGGGGSSLGRSQTRKQGTQGRTRRRRTFVQPWRPRVRSRSRRQTRNRNRDRARTRGRVRVIPPSNRIPTLGIVPDDAEGFFVFTSRAQSRVRRNLFYFRCFLHGFGFVRRWGFPPFPSERREVDRRGRGDRGAEKHGRGTADHARSKYGRDAEFV